MNEILDFFVNNNGAAFAVALIIFIITLLLIVKRSIGFIYTIILLAFALISGLFVANADLFREILRGFTLGSTPEEQETVVQLKNQFYKSFDDLKTEFKDQKVEFQKILDKAKTREDHKAAPVDVKAAVPASAPVPVKTPETASDKKIIIPGAPLPQ